MVALYDENGEKRDRFSTKPAEKGPKNYIVRGLCFSPDSTRLAVAQSDCIVFVYKLGLEWGEVGVYSRRVEDGGRGGGLSRLVKQRVHHFCGEGDTLL